MVKPVSRAFLCTIPGPFKYIYTGKTAARLFVADFRDVTSFGYLNLSLAIGNLPSLLTLPPLVARFQGIASFDKGSRRSWLACPYIYHPLGVTSSITSKPWKNVNESGVQKTFSPEPELQRDEGEAAIDRILPRFG